MKILLCMSGASGVELGFYLLSAIEKLKNECELFCIVSENALLSLKEENKKIKDPLKFYKDKLGLKNTIFLDNKDLKACVSSGSFGIEKTVITPCSINTLAKIYSGIADSLITRAAAVAIKENKKLILAPREMPFSSISLKHMFKLSKIGVIIAPAVYASYSNSKDLDELRNFFVGKWLSLLDIEHNLYKKWE
ncbi:UbiX family flavin prenyltransferase [uncultured Campylobacter sp.]|uniref:UbiX family flavin prenyltransferase n=1 Tax=uncultured Campylobacter sp. TaxID=218934 RepID=UPI0026289544|nr:UbiX family flavin prenyltransferase [uncultured Campylobacter sp.]